MLQSSCDGEGSQLYRVRVSSCLDRISGENGLHNEVSHRIYAAHESCLLHDSFTHGRHFPSKRSCAAEVEKRPLQTTSRAQANPHAPPYAPGYNV